MSAALPRWKCHKVVQAAKIISSGSAEDGGIRLDLDTGESVTLDASWYGAHPKASSDGYYVVYEDGYTSYSPAQAFEDGYARLPGGLDGLKPYQQRVVIEAAELEPRLEQLTTFLGTETFEALPADEAEDLRDQHDAMADYLARLKSRIARFNPPTGPEPSGGQ